MIESDKLSLEELDYHLETGVLVDVVESGSNNRFTATVEEFVETDVARDDHAKIYRCHITDVQDGSYEEGDVVRVDNRDVTRVRKG